AHRGGQHVIGVAAVERNSGHLDARLTGKEVAPAARVAIAAVPPMPADSDALAGRPSGRNARPERVDDADHLVARHARVFDPGKVAFLGERIAVADAAGLNLEPDRP